MEKALVWLQKLTWNYVALALLAAGAYFYFTYDTTPITAKEESIKTATDTFHTLEKKIEEAKKLEQEYELKKRQYKELVNELIALQGALPKQFYLPDLLNDILTECKQLEIEITSITPDRGEEKNEFYSTLGFNIEAKGTFLQFLILSERLTSMKRIASLNQLSFGKDATRANIMLGGDDGAFAASKLSGGKYSFPGLVGKLKLVTYRYRGDGKSTVAGAENEKKAK